jgi:hypothetical protein
MASVDNLKQLTERSVDLLRDLEKIEAKRKADGVSLFQVHDLATRGANLIQAVTGTKSVYAENLRIALKQKGSTLQYLAVAGVLQAFHLDLTKGYLPNIRHEIEAVVVSEILDQAKKLLRTKGVHPAAAVIVACAGVEEFLRSWCEEKGISIPEKQRGIARFAQELRTNGQIQLPIERRIQSWADYRNDAAHGANWPKITPDIAGRLVREIQDFLVENREVLG